MMNEHEALICGGVWTTDPEEYGWISDDEPEP